MPHAYSTQLVIYIGIDVYMSASEPASIKSMRYRIYTSWHENPFSFSSEREKVTKNWKTIACLLAMCISIDFDHQFEMKNYWNKNLATLSLSLCLFSHKWNWFFSQAEKEAFLNQTQKLSYVSKSSNKRAAYTNIIFECDNYLSFIRIYENE